MTTRLLPRSEWVEKLAGTDLERVHVLLNDDAQIVVVEDESGAVIGHWAIFNVAHVECVWIAEAHRKGGSVARRLLSKMRDVARSIGARVVFTASLTPEVDRLLAKLRATKLPGDHYVFGIGD